MRRALLLAVLFALLAHPAAGQVRVVATTSSMGMLVREVGGRDISVTTLVPPDRDPHYLLARPSMMVALRRADLLVAVGADLEVGWLPAAIQGANNPRIVPGQPGYFEGAVHIELIERDQAADRARGDVHPSGNPHYYMDPRRMAAVGRALAATLGALDPPGRPGYQQRAEAFAAAVEARVPRWRTRAAGAAGVVFYHKDGNYLARLLDVPILGFIEPLARHPAHRGAPPRPRPPADRRDRHHPLQHLSSARRSRVPEPQSRLADAPTAARGVARRDRRGLSRSHRHMGNGDRRRRVLNDTAPLLAASALVAGYTTAIVGPVSFSVGPGDVLGVAGPNGSGKTTLFNAIIGTARIFSGRIHRRPGTRMSVQRQHPVRLREMPLSGRELLRLTDACTRLLPPALEPFVDRRIDRISGGQFQLLQVWACLGSPAELVLLDEPTNNMDPGALAACADLLIGAREDRGVLIISHDQRLLRRVCTHIVDVAA